MLRTALRTANWPTASLTDKCIRRVLELQQEHPNLSSLKWATLKVGDHEHADSNAQCRGVQSQTCPDTGVHYCCLKCKGIRRCPSNSGLETCACQPHEARILVHGHNAILSNRLLQTGKWEADHLGAVEDYHKKHGGSVKNNKKFLDIGANLGYFSLMAAKRGYKVTAFEGMKSNAKMMNVSLCVSHNPHPLACNSQPMSQPNPSLWLLIHQANPDAEERITLHNVGLGKTKEKCFIVSINSNVADGMVKCGIDTSSDYTPQEGYGIRGVLDIDTLDSMIDEDYFMLKIDVEGAEPLVLSKEGSDRYFAKHKKQYMMTEAWSKSNRLSYFTRLDELGYTLRPVKYNRGGGEGMVNNKPILNTLLSQGAQALKDVGGVDFFGVLKGN